MAQTKREKAIHAKKKYTGNWKFETPLGTMITDDKNFATKDHAFHKKLHEGRVGKLKKEKINEIPSGYQKRYETSLTGTEYNEKGKKVNVNAPFKKHANLNTFNMRKFD